MRVYVPLTLNRLAEVHKAGELGAETASLSAYAVTPALREWCGSDDTEELEYAALSQAAAASLGLIAGDSGAARRRVVLAADVPDGALGQGAPVGELGEVRVDGVLPLKKVAAVHVDAEEAAAEVAAALEGGGEVEDHELLWFATQEIPGLIA